MSAMRRVNRALLTRLDKPQRHYCPVHQWYWTSRYVPAPCRLCEPVLYDKLFPRRNANGEDSES